MKGRAAFDAKMDGGIASDRAIKEKKVDSTKIDIVLAKCWFLQKNAYTMRNDYDVN